MVDPILALGNALIALESVECKGRQNHDYLLFAMQQVEGVKKMLKEVQDKHDACDGQGTELPGELGVEPYDGRSYDGRASAENDDCGGGGGV